MDLGAQYDEQDVIAASGAADECGVVFLALGSLSYPAVRAHRVYHSARQLLGKELMLDAFRDLTTEEITALCPAVEA